MYDLTSHDNAYIVTMTFIASEHIFFEVVKHRHPYYHRKFILIRDNL